MVRFDCEFVVFKIQNFLSKVPSEREKAHMQIQLAYKRGGQGKAERRGNLVPRSSERARAV